MILKVRVQPRASKNSIVSDGESLRAYLTKPAQEGKANSQLIELLAGYLKIKKYQIRILQGEKSRNKLIEVNA
jgi:uncharacterized protein